MKLETLRKLWAEKNPGGNVWYTDNSGSLSETPSGKSKKFAVNFKDGGKLYTYTASSVYVLAERFDLIPDSNLNYWTESRRAISAMDAGETFTTPGGLYDTIRNILETENPGYSAVIERSDDGRDEYDRQTFTFTGYKLVKIGERVW